MFAWRDGLATVFVAVGLVVYGAWAIAGGLPGFESAGAVSLVVLALGIAASLSAVVAGFDELLNEGSRLYVAVASALGGIALTTGLWGVVDGNAIAVTVLVMATVALWAISTARHLGVHVPALHTGPR